MLMIIWFRHLPQMSIDIVEWTPFIKSNWFRKHYMKFVYLLQIIIFLMSLFFDAWVSRINTFSLTVIGVFVFIIHEYLHILVINKKGDISLTFSGTFFWIHTNAVLSKMRFWLFMSLPFISLSIMPAVASFFVSGNIKSILLFISWINLIISSSDIINSLLIAIKPKNSIFFRGYYRVEKG
ncbi:metalloprotease family protein [Sporosarcina aquimarina]|uniref:metalloprotease family protein n=1 Tax=Sporosarcina aquimarina TaxID=114975 RepID=UPI00203B0642|nr:metalloprotease family protein [Sporosarcina aquimarina]